MSTKNYTYQLILILLFSSLTLFGQNQSASNTILIKRGSMLTLKMMETISSSEVEAGYPVRMEVLTNVVVGGEVVIKSGTFAEGIVVNLRKAGIFGKAAKLELSASSVQAIDGQRIPLKTTHFIKKEGRNRKGMAIGVGVLIPATGIILSAPITLPLVFVGILVKGGEVKINAGQEIPAKVEQDILVYYNR